MRLVDMNIMYPPTSTFKQALRTNTFEEFNSKADRGEQRASLANQSWAEALRTSSPKILCARKQKIFIGSSGTQFQTAGQHSGEYPMLENHSGRTPLHTKRDNPLDIDQYALIAL